MSANPSCSTAVPNAVLACAVCADLCAKPFEHPQQTLTGRLCFAGCVVFVLLAIEAAVCKHQTVGSSVGGERKQRRDGSSRIP
jgi:hypothetical protein